MFPIPFNFPFRKKDGSLSTIGDEIGGGGSSYTLPTASADIKGGVKIGAGLTMEGEVLKNTNPTPATPYTLPVASADTLGGVKVGTNLSIDENGVLSASGGGGGGLKYLSTAPFKLESTYASSDFTLQHDAMISVLWLSNSSVDYTWVDYGTSSEIALGVAGSGLSDVPKSASFILRAGQKIRSQAYVTISYLA